MPAHVVVCGETPPGVGGEFEDECVRSLAAALSDPLTIVRNVSLPRGGGAYYEYDAIVIGPKGWEILEFKCIRPFADVYEDHIAGTAGYVAERIFSRLDNKAKVLAGRKTDPRLEVQPGQRQGITAAVVLPNSTAVTFRQKGTAFRPIVRSLEETVRHFVAAGQAVSREDQKILARARAAWEAFAARSAPGSQRNPRHLGRYMIKRHLSSPPGTLAYQAMDEPPCRVDVHLREYTLDPTLSRAEVERYIEEVSREMLTLRRVRHPNISCLIGHFATGSSLVHVSDWFDGCPLEESWAELRGASPSQRIGLCYRLASGLAFCHEKGVFHRNVCADAVLVTSDLEDLRLTSFEMARDLELTSTLSDRKLSGRDPRVIPPEELGRRVPGNARLGDVFQLGVLFYRIMENGLWPYDDPIAYASSACAMRPMTWWLSQEGDRGAPELVSQMLAVDPTRRPDPLQRVEAALRSIAGS